MGSARLMAKFPLRCCGHPSPLTRTHTHTHTQTNAATIITDAGMHIHKLSYSHLSAHVCVARVLTAQRPSGVSTGRINKLPFSLETRIWPDIVTQTAITTTRARLEQEPRAEQDALCMSLGQWFQLLPKCSNQYSTLNQVQHQHSLTQGNHGIWMSGYKSKIRHAPLT